MRLEHHDDAAVEAGAGGGDDRGNLRGMVPVVVDDHHAARFTAQLKAPFGAVEFLEATGDLTERNPGLEADRDRAERVHQVVTAGHAQVQRAELGGRPFDRRVNHAAARAERLERHVLAGDRGLAVVEAVGHHAPRHPRHQRPHRPVVDARHDGAVERHLVGEVDEGLLQRVPAAVTLHVLVVDIRNHRDRRRQLQERPVAFIRLDDHVIAASEPRVAAEGAQAAADHRRRIEARPLEHQRHHRRGRRLAVRAGDGDAVAKAHQFREHLGARNHRNPAPPRLVHLGIPRLDRRRRHHDIRVADVRSVVPARDADAEAGEPRRHVRRPGIRAADLVAEVRQQLRDAAHADAADADKMDAAGAP